MTSFSLLKVYGIFFRSSRVAKSVVRGRIWLNFKLMRDFMYVIVASKYEKDPIKKAEKTW